MRKVLLGFLVLIVSVFGFSLILGTINHTFACPPDSRPCMGEWDTGGGGDGGDDPCQSCDGQDHDETDNASSGDTSVPPDVQALADTARIYGGTHTSPDGTTTTVSGDTISIPIRIKLIPSHHRRAGVDTNSV